MVDVLVTAKSKSRCKPNEEFVAGLAQSCSHLILEQPDRTWAELELFFKDEWRKNWSIQMYQPVVFFVKLSHRQDLGCPG